MASLITSTTRISMSSAAAPKAGKRLSGLQKDVLSLYRTILRESLKKDRAASATPTPSFTNLAFPTASAEASQERAQTPTTTTQYARSEFRKQAHSVRKLDFKRVEFKLRQGHKKLKLLQMPGVQVVRGSD